jgi:hypothetical protein
MGDTVTQALHYVHPILLTRRDRTVHPEQYTHGFFPITTVALESRPEQKLCTCSTDKYLEVSDPRLPPLVCFSEMVDF